MGGAWLRGQDFEDWTRPPGLELGPPLTTCPLGGLQTLSPPVKQGYDRIRGMNQTMNIKGLVQRLVLAQR